MIDKCCTYKQARAPINPRNTTNHIINYCVINAKKNTITKLSVFIRTKTVIKTINTTDRQRSERKVSRSEKEDFSHHGKIPQRRSEKLTSERFWRRTPVKVSLEFLNEAKRILDIVNKKYPSVDEYLDEVFGPQITQDEATKYLIHYWRPEGLVPFVWKLKQDN